MTIAVRRLLHGQPVDATTVDKFLEAHRFPPVAGAQIGGCRDERGEGLGSNPGGTRPETSVSGPELLGQSDGVGFHCRA